jgi:hypothetical protein
MFAEIKDGTLVTWPYNYDTLCRANPNTAFNNNLTLLEMYSGKEANLAGNVLVKVVEQPQPTFDAKTQSITLDLKPTLNNGEWQLGWTVSTLTQAQRDAAEQKKAAVIREQRTQKLKDSDWTQIADAPVDKTAWAAYRQALRDVPSQAGFPWDVQWPSTPE